MVRSRQAPGGGRRVEIPPERLPGWLNRFAARHQGITAMTPSPESVVVAAADRTTATLAVPFAPMDPCGAEPIEALLNHLGRLGDLAVILVRERAYSIGICRAGAVTTSSTDTRYVQSRTKAGGWSQQRYARRRGNQRQASYRAAAEAASRVLAPYRGRVDGLVAGGDATALRAVLADPRLRSFTAVPTRTFTDVAEPRRAVLDEVAVRCLSVEITVRGSDATSRS